MQRAVFTLCLTLVCCAYAVVGIGQEIPENYKDVIADAKIEQFPWFLEVIFNGNNKYCTAILVTSNWALTTGVCGLRIESINNDRMSTYSLRVHAGNRDLTYYYSHPQEGVLIENVIPHPDFKHSRHHINDLALIKLKTPLTINNETIAQACFYKSEEETTKPFERLVGLGFSMLFVYPQRQDLTTFNRVVKSGLQRINFTDISFDNMVGELKNLQKIKVKSSRAGVCLFDLATPLVAEMSGELNYVVGMKTRTNLHCKQEEYTRISPHLGWISEVIKQGVQIDEPMCLKNVIFM